MTDGQSEWMCDERRLIPDSGDQMEVPKRPDLRCREHVGHCALLREVLERLEEVLEILEAEKVGGAE